MKNRLLFSALILSGGASTRFGGSPKALHKSGPSTFIGTIIKSLSSIKGNSPDRVYAVTGRHHREISAYLKGTGVITVYNRSWRNGQFSSLVKGLKTAGPGVGHVLVWPVDTPWVRPATLGRIISEAFGENAKAFVPSVVAGKKRRAGHPVLLSPDAVTEIVRGGHSRLDRYLLKIKKSICYVPVRDPKILKDIDRPEDIPDDRS